MFSVQLLVFTFGLAQCQFPNVNVVAPPTRSIDLWNPFGTTPEPRPQGAAPHRDEVLIRLPIGDIIGKRVVIPDLPWTPNQERSELIPNDRVNYEPSPLPKKNNVTIYQFLGVPYAEPPVSQRRFKPPQQLINFPGQPPFLAITPAAACAQDVELTPQPEVNRMYPWTVSEDCLYLNIFTPDVSKASGMVYPVLVFIHGGNFQTGSANDWPGHVLASRGMVVVTIGYRLGAFGFMSLGDPDTGNYGLQDQRMAMQWVRDHIASFGGDPQAVTLAGHDAGGMSVGLHMLSPLSKGLFRNAMALSGAAVSYHAVIGKPALAFNNTIKLGRYLGCTDKLPNHVWDCILTRSTNDILRATTDIPIEYNRYLFLPSVDGRQIPGHPLWILRNAPTGVVDVPSPVPLMMGMNLQDGSEVILEDRTLGEFNDFNNVDYQYMRGFVLEYAFRHNYTMNREAVCDAIIDRYTYWPDPSDDWNLRQNFIELATDAYYTAPIADEAHLHSVIGSRTWMFVNTYNFSRGYKEFRFIEDWRAVSRESDLYLLFGYAHAPPEFRPPQLKNVTFTGEDKNATTIFTNLARRFVTFQDPNFLNDGTWAALEPRRHWYLEFNYTQGDSLDSPGLLKRDFRYQSVAFWTNYIPALVNYMTTTFPPEVVSEREGLIILGWVVGVLGLLLMLMVVIAAALGYMLCDNTLPKQREHEELVEYPENFTSQSSVHEPYSRVSAM